MKFAYLLLAAVYLGAVAMMVVASYSVAMLFIEAIRVLTGGA